MNKIILSVCIIFFAAPQFLFGENGWNKADQELELDIAQSSDQNQSLSTSEDYMVVEDSILLISNEPQNGSDEDTNCSNYNNNSTFQLIAEQVDHTIGSPYPTIWVDGYGSDDISNPLTIAEEDWIRSLKEDYSMQKEWSYTQSIATPSAYNLNDITIHSQRPLTKGFELKTLPNPLQDLSFFEMKKEIQNGSIEIYNWTGEVVMQKKIKGNQFGLKRNDLTTGIYFYKITANGKAINAGEIIVN